MRQALWSIRPPAVSAAIAPAVIAALRIPAPSAQASLVNLLGRLKPDPAATVPVLLAVMRDPTESGAAAGGAPEPRVAETVVSPAHVAARALSEVAPGTPQAGEAMAALVEVVRSGPPRLRRSAADALGAFGPAAVSAVPILINLLEQAVADEAAVPAGGAAIRALRQIAPGTPAADEALAAVIEALRSPAAWIRQQALETLPAFGPAAASALPLVRRLRDSDSAPEVRRAASQALEKFKS